jgi:tripartite-type tricarboxylate transporter receptor subunit TctC
MLMTTSSFVINPSFFDKVPYDPYWDFEPVTLAVDSTNVLMVNSSVPVTTVKELVALIRAQSRQIYLRFDWRWAANTSRGGEPPSVARS